MKELVKAGEVERVSDGDTQLIWAAQGQGDGLLGPGVRAWRYGSAVVVAAPGLSGRDRMAVKLREGGHIDDAAYAVRRALAEVGTSYRLFGEDRLVRAVTQRVPGMVGLRVFQWMETDSPAPPPADEDGERPAVTWLDASAAQRSAALFDAHFPRSHAQPGRSGVRHWAGVLDEKETDEEADDAAGAAPLAVAAEAWPATGCGLLAGVLTAPAARGRGLAAAVCGFVVNSLVERYGRAGLMVDADNEPALRTYRRLGMTGRLLSAAHVPAG
ncbi:GNAT family N-acetyltransferase [Streptomyces albus]|uniref:GNAT family N-acetyltransferase n=1 Tax=Streptomyces albus TaxID=1888 RepID=UPI0024AD21B8|nr:GNAT family N-acetyltransferase [Streptomyces albus]MDI6407355.1 GNAT family N-acetyltransferase [Streptomyces albus]